VKWWKKTCQLSMQAQGDLAIQIRQGTKGCHYTSQALNNTTSKTQDVQDISIMK
jgi:hypothetical protein